jgi:hypothetical protein
MNDSLPCRDVGARDGGLVSRLQDLLLGGRCSGGRSKWRARVEATWPPTQRSIFWWALRMAGLRRGYMTSCAAGGGLHQCDVQQVFSKVADGGLLWGDGQRLLRGDGRAKSGVARGAAARRLGRLLGQQRQERCGFGTPLCCEVEQQKCYSVWGKGTQWQSFCKYVQRVRGGSTIEVVIRCETPI